MAGLPVPKGLSMEKMAGFTGANPVKCFIYQQDEALLFSGQSMSSAARLLGTLLGSGSVIQAETLNDAGMPTASNLYSIGQRLPLPRNQGLRLRTDREELVLVWNAQRPGDGLNAKGLPDIVWCQIPEGKVVLEKNKGSFKIQPFYLARYPVTNAQFQSFIEAKDGYRNPRWWTGLDASPKSPKPSRWPEANHPRESVSWFEAMAFCAWLSKQLGYTVTLPTEWQWQQAACSGQADWDYPWGKSYKFGYANINESYQNVGQNNFEKTTAVGLYPQGDSLQGVSDLSGNVWEWCLNAYDSPENTDLVGAFSRVVRGGSWLYGRGGARASYRYHYTPGYRYFNLGFRLCRPSPL